MQPASARAGLDFKIVVPLALRVQDITHPESVDVTAAQVAQGYIDVEDPH